MKYKCKLPVEFYEYAEEIIGETSDVRENGIREIVNWLDDDDNCDINCERDVIILLYFLRSTKFNLDRTKQKIKNYYRVRSLRIEWFKDCNPFLPEIAELLDLGVFIPLIDKDSENRQVFIIRTGVHDPKLHSQNNVLKTSNMLVDLVMHLNESISIFGIVVILDMKNVTFSHALQLPPSMIKKLVECWEAYPCMPKKMEFINAPFYINAMLNTFRLFMSAKMKSRVFVTKGMSTIDVQLPSDIGGTGKSYHELSIYWKNMSEKYSTWFRDREQYKTIVNSD